MASIYLDSCVVIYLVQGPVEIFNIIINKFNTIGGEQPQYCISDLTRMECRVWPIREKNPQLLEQYDRFFASSDIVHLPISTKVFDMATELRANSGIKIADAIHLATSIHYNCDQFWTNDQRLVGAAGGRIQIELVE